MTNRARSTILFAASLCALFGATATPSEAEELNFVSWGGDWQGAQTKAISEPWSASTGNSVANISYNGEVGPVKAMVAAGSYEWDVIDVEWSVANILCEEGLIEPVADDFWASVGGKNKFHPSAIHKCGAGNVLGTTIMAYDAGRVSPDKAPKNWADFWNVDQYPGSRSLRRTPRGNLEFALLADGVPLNEIYQVLRTPEGVDRAFAKLEAIKPHIGKWWTAGAEPPQLLADGEVTYTSAFNGRISAANRAENRKFEIVWWGQYYTPQFYVIPLGSPKKDLAMSWIAYSLGDKSQAEIAELIPYGPVNNDAIPLVSPEVQKLLPSNPENGFPQDALLPDEDWWAEVQEPLTERFEAWLAR